MRGYGAACIAAILLSALMGCGVHRRVPVPLQEHQQWHGMDEDQDQVPAEQDCDDQDSKVSPGYPELCDGKDNDCDSVIDEDVTRTFYADEDGDGFGDPFSVGLACVFMPGYVENKLDCRDDNAHINFGRVEICGDGIDNDCRRGDEPCITISPAKTPKQLIRALKWSGLPPIDLTVVWAETSSDASEAPVEPNLGESPWPLASICDLDSVEVNAERLTASVVSPQPSPIRYGLALGAICMVMVVGGAGCKRWYDHRQLQQEIVTAHIAQQTLSDLAAQFRRQKGIMHLAQIQIRRHEADLVAAVHEQARRQRIEAALVSDRERMERAQTRMQELSQVYQRVLQVSGIDAEHILQ